MYQIAICDDEPAICAQIIRILDSHCMRESFSITAFSNGEDLLDSLRAGQTFVLLILDIELQSQNGVMIGKYLREELQDDTTQVLYLSAHTKYAMELFDVRPLNFLVKPLDAQKLLSCVSQALQLLPMLDETLTIFVGKQVRRIPLRKIRYIESYHRRVTLHTTQGEYICSQRLSEVISHLPYPTFFQIHQSFVVNDHFVRHIRYDCLCLDNGIELSISQNFRKQVRELVFQRIPRAGGAL